MPSKYEFSTPEDRARAEADRSLFYERQRAEEKRQSAEISKLKRESEAAQIEKMRAELHQRVRETQPKIIDILADFQAVNGGSGGVQLSTKDELYIFYEDHANYMGGIFRYRLNVAK